MSDGILFIVSAPSGAGKTSLVSALLKADGRLTVSISHTTRPRRPREVDGEDYHFVDRPTFERMIAQDAFIEHAEVFGNHYGTSRDSVAQALATGSDVVLEIDWQGAALMRRVLPEVVGIFIVPPSQQALRQRLQERAQDDPAVIESRLAAARSEMQHHHEFDYLVINDDFDTALRELEAIVTAERCREARRSSRNRALLNALLAG